MQPEDVNDLVRRTLVSRPLSRDLLRRWGQLREDDPAAAEAALDRLTAKAANRVVFGLAGRDLRA